MLTKDQVEALKPDERLELLRIVWSSFVSSPDALPVSPQEMDVVRERSLAHQADPASALNEQQFWAELKARHTGR